MRFAKGKSRTKVAMRSKGKSKQAAKSRKPQASAVKSANAPLNLRKANAKPVKRVTGKGKGSSS